jgi:hypothetical protein
MWITSLRNDGLVSFSAECMACYRRHVGGLTAGFADPIKQRLLAEMWREMAICVNRVDSPAFRKHVATHYMWAARGFADQARLQDSFSSLRFAFAYSDEGFFKKCREFGKNAARAVLLWARSPLPPHHAREPSL